MGNGTDNPKTEKGRTLFGNPPINTSGELKIEKVLLPKGGTRTPQKRRSTPVVIFTKGRVSRFTRTDYVFKEGTTTASSVGTTTALDGNT